MRNLCAIKNKKITTIESSEMKGTYRLNLQSFP